MSYTIKDLLSHSQFSMTYFELQARVAKMGEVDSSWAARTGKRGSWIVSDVGFQVLIRLRALETEGSSVGSALLVIREELSEATKVDLSTELEAGLPPPNQAIELELLRQKIQMQDELIASLKLDKERVQDLLDRLTLALPSPKQYRFNLFSRLFSRPALNKAPNDPDSLN